MGLSHRVWIQIDSDATKIGWNRPAHIGAVADLMTVVAQLVERSDELGRSETPVWTKEIMDAELAKAEVAMVEADDDSSPVMPQRFAKEVAEFFGPDAIVSVDGGDIVSTTARWLQTSTAGHVLDPGPFGTLGTGALMPSLPKLCFPIRRWAWFLAMEGLDSTEWSTTRWSGSVCRSSV